MGKIMFNGVDYSAPSTAGVTGVKGDAETAYRTGNVNVTSDNIGALSTTGDASNTTTTFTQASARTNLTTKEKLSVSLGKITKWFADLKNVAFTGSASDLTTGTLSSARLPSATSSILGGVKITTSSAVTNSNGLALAATEKNASIDGTLANQISTLDNNLSGLHFSVLTAQMPTSRSAFYLGAFASSSEKGYIVSAMCSTDKITWVNADKISDIAFTVNAANNGQAQVRGDIGNDTYYGKWCKVIVASVD